MPQLNPEFFISQLFWLAVFFSIMFIILWKVSLPRIATVLNKRQNKIDKNLSTAKELQEKALEVEKNINFQINNTREETGEKIKETIKLLQEETSSKLSSLDKELEEKISISEKEIIKNKENQMKTINDEIANITKITVAKMSDLKISDNDINNALKLLKGKLN